MNRRVSALCCLLLTALLLCALPSLWKSLNARSGERMAERLRPKKAQTLVVWMLSDATEGRKHLNEQIALFESQNEGARVYLRRADSTELFAESTVLPDIVLFSPGAIANPSRALYPIASLSGAGNLSEDALVSGRSSRVQYGVPLWYVPSVLTVPTAFFPAEAVPLPSPTETSFFNLGTPVPTVAEPRKRAERGESLPNASLIPWQKLLEPDAMTPPKGLALIQLLSMCPASLRTALIASLTGQEMPSPTSDGAPSPAATEALAPIPTATPAPKASAMTLAAYKSALARGEPLAGFALTPACTEKVLLLGICNDHTLSREFLKHLLSPAAQSALPGHALLPVVSAAPSGDAMTRRLMEQYQKGLLFPNAFEYTAEELSALCLDAFQRNQAPVETLLRLR